MSSSESTPIISVRHPKAFFEMLAAICRNVPANHVLDEEDQAKFLALYNVIDFKLVKAPRSEMHQNPLSPEGYFSSSYVADKNAFDIPQGGYGPPGSVNGSFCHNHNDESFKELHPDVDQSKYGSPSPLRASERCTPSRWTNANAHRYPRYTPHQRPSSPPATPPRSPYVIPTITTVDVDAAEQDLYENNATTAPPDQPAQLEDEENEIPSDTSPIKAGATEGYSSVAEDAMSKDDSGVAMDGTLYSGLEEQKDDAITKDGGISFSQDSAYATQPFKNFEDDSNKLNDLHFKLRSSSPSDAPEVFAGRGALESSNRLLDELDEEARRSARLDSQSRPTTPNNDIIDIATSSNNLDPASAPTSSLGKRKADSDGDIDSDKDSKGQEPNAKRVKLTES
ncbi:hypothetical protein HBH56_047870 [Parastagonospora nodorum]|uniref:Uncharacterized protein n=1 Tax=Phaeosphaeria nodorum (strain SN15 / ATCC MYA-4574 / FGSC 10173) TaxID=321614 RepID=A0A7U2ETM6_PHANO|nr:hypothetical protein HBH56_047870 [Parastagonospora nodorum]QRC92497.1 hypothetical protein JI435_084340 [Parastagonospora nodorum SN15]KAH3933256.1 hypothetical protein HBH54_075610 [Parastagonospora nodorum]KAH4124564.1 hypothetical protein HBH45_238350 [Parastagonospora nodorum]KAH4169099.1 hypothetical protein HBH44_048540 [Parastagonospora nodorum]